MSAIWIKFYQNMRVIFYDGKASDGHGIAVGQQFQTLFHPDFAMLIVNAHEERAADNFGDAVVIACCLDINDLAARDSRGLVPRQSCSICEKMLELNPIVK